MPTRPPTPGPSNISSQATQPADSTPVNNSLTKKRASSEAGDDSRESKKIRKSVEIENISSSFVAVGNSKDKDKKKRKKKKRKMSVVAVEAEQQRAAVRGSTAPLSQSRSNSQLPKRTVVTAVLENVLGAIDQPHTPVPYEDGISGIEVQDDINDKEGIKPILTDKGKGRADSQCSSPQRVTPSIPSPTEPASAITSISDSLQTQITRLTEQLAAQTDLLEKHHAHTAHVHQSLTCQICLDLLHKPFALAPCGHVACYPCLVRWFTASATGNNNNPLPDDIEQLLDGNAARSGRFFAKKKTCPLCRTVVRERPVEVWGIKSMVGTLVRSCLVDLPVPAPPMPDEQGANANINEDPWRNIFRRGRPHDLIDFLQPMMNLMPPPPADNENREDMGMYDAEDGGVYRCLDCMHEIWAGTCTNCHRMYAGHERDEDDEGEDDDDDMIGLHHLEMPLDNVGRPNLFMGRALHRLMQNRDFGFEPGLDTDDEDDDEDEDAEEDVYIGLGGGGVLDADEEDEDEDELDNPMVLGLGRQPPFQGLPAVHVQHGPGLPLFAELMSDDEGGLVEDGGIARVYEVSDEEEDEDYESSFIQDDSEEENVQQNHRRARRLVDIIDLAAEEDDSDDDGVRQENRLAPPPANRDYRDPWIIDDEDGDEDEDEVDDDPRLAARQLGRRTRLGGRANAPIVLDSEEDEDDVW